MGTHKINYVMKFRKSISICQEEEVLNNKMVEMTIKIAEKEGFDVNVVKEYSPIVWSYVDMPTKQDMYKSKENRKDMNYHYNRYKSDYYMVCGISAWMNDEVIPPFVLDSFWSSVAQIIFKYGVC